jgi:hypothetical protein
MSDELFKEIIKRCSEYYLSNGVRIDENNIEKDYHVCKILSDLQNSDYANRFLFKGGTSLSKAWGIIDRFSEDVDLCVVPDINLSLEKTKQMKDAISKSIEKLHPKIDGHPDEVKGGMRRKTIHPYKSFFDYGNSNIIIEVTALRPNSNIRYESKNIKSYMQIFLENIERNDLIEQVGVKTTPVLSVHPVRTLCDKLCRTAKSASDDSVMRTNIRDIYDIHCLLNDNIIKTDFEDEKFVGLFHAIKNEELQNNNIVPNFSDLELFKKPKIVFQNYKNDFAIMEKLIFTKMPTIAEMAQTFSSNYARFKMLDS